MNAVTFIRSTLETSYNVIIKLAEDMQDAPLTFPTPCGGNHPLWLLGHIAAAESKLVREFVFGKSCQYPEWTDVFGPETNPVADASKYPAYSEVLEAFKKTRQETLQLLSTLTDADLDKPSQAPDSLKEVLPNVSDCLRAAVFHCSVHTGQFIDTRRALGRKPILFTPPKGSMRSPARNPEPAVV